MSSSAIVKPFVKRFSAYLVTQREPVVEAVSAILVKPPFKFVRGKTFDDVTALFFEYQYDYFDLACWPTDKRETPIAAMVSIPSDKRAAKKSPRSKWRSFYPEALCDGFEAVVAKHPDDEDDLREAYNGARTRVFERWFSQCWKAAAKVGGPPVHAFFSIHDTFFRTNLRTAKECNGDEIAKLVKKRPG